MATVPVVTSVSFGVFSPEDVDRLAVAKITHTTLFSNGVPVSGGLCDPRLGCSDRRVRCSTCYRCVADCPGHYGVLHLPCPIYHPQFIDVVHKMLKCVCFFCGSLLLPEADARALPRDRRGRLSALVAATRSRRTCASPSCGGVSPQYVRQGLSIRADFSRAVFGSADEEAFCARPLSPGDARLILRNISDSTLSIMGFDPDKVRPENFVMTRLLVPPPIVRPGAVTTDARKSRGHDDLTTKLLDAIKACCSLRELVQREAESIPEFGLSLGAQQALAELTFHVASYMNNESRGQRQSFQRSGVLMKSLASRLRGKDGRIRGSLMGKRVDFSGRSVISPDSEMDVDQVGVPQRVALVLTVPETATPGEHLERLRARVLSGSGRLDGAHSVCRAGRLVLLEFADTEREASRLAPGDVVHRYLQDDDYILFNRQPSLHRGSMMSFRARVCDGNTFRVNLAITPSVAGDFDGDEMNVHCPQTTAAAVEAAELLPAPRHVVSPQASKPCIAIVQDALVGSYLLTDEATRLSRQQVCELHALLRRPRRPPPTPGPDGLVTGRQAFSMLLRDDLVYSCSRGAGRVDIARGSVSGRLCKASLGTSSGSLVHHLWIEYGPEEATAFIGDCQRLVNRWLMWRGFSVRLSDCMASPEVRRQVAHAVSVGARRVAAIEADEELQRVLPERAEAACLQITTRLLTQAGQIVHAGLDIRRNSLYQTVTAGSKGNLVNIAQLAGCVGQQSLDGHRTFGRGRLPLGEPGLEHALKKDGFVLHNYVEGLEPCEFFFHAMAGREGLCDAAVKTSATGYTQRRLMKAMEATCVQHDGTVRNARGHVVQFAYGYDGLDASYVVRQSMAFAAEEPQALREALGAAWEPFACCLRRLRDRQVGCLAMDLRLPACCGPFRASQHLAAARLAPAGPPLPPEQALRLVEAAVADLTSGSDFVSRDLSELHLRWTLRPGELVGLGAAQLEAVVRALRQDLRRARVEPGEAVGPIAAQALGERFSQLCLSNFRFAGVDNATVTQGVPRIKELVDATRVIKTPMIYAVVKPSHAARLDRIRRSLPQLTLAHVVRDARVLREPDPFGSSLGPEDAYCCAREELFAPREAHGACPFVLRLRLRRGRLLERQLTPGHVAEALAASVQRQLSLAWSEPDMQTCFVRARPVLPPGTDEAACRKVCDDLYSRALREVSLTGVAGIREARPAKRSLWARTDDPLALRASPVSALELSGSNFAGVLAVPEILPELTVTNDVLAVAAVLGIEAAARVLFCEIQETLNGESISERHIALLVDVMCRPGYVLPVSRHGLNRTADSAPLARCSFEESVEQLFEAALFADSDDVRDVTARVMVGRRAAVGTGLSFVRGSTRPVQPLRPLPEEDEVVFTTTSDAVPLAQDSAPLDRPYASGGRLQPLSAAHGEHFGWVDSSSRREYEPSSPRCEPRRKRPRYEPTSPRAAGIA